MTLLQQPELASNTLLVSPDRIVVGKFLYRFAWVIEVFAVMIGLAIALMTMATSFTEMEKYSSEGLGFAQYTSIFIAAVPFIMVAVVEATKIPFVEAYYKTTKLIWKIIFGISLLFIAIITFESAINGFERNFNALMYGVDKFKKELVNIEEKIPPLLSQRDKLANLSSEIIEKNYNDRNSELSKQRENQSALIVDRINSLRATTRTEYVASLKVQVAEKQKELAIVHEERKAALKSLANENHNTLQNASTELSSQRRTYQTQLSQEQQYLDELKDEAKFKIEDASFFTVKEVRERWDRKVSEQVKVIQELRQQLNSINANAQSKQIRENYRVEVNATRMAFKDTIDTLNKEITSLNLQISKSVSNKEKEVENIISKHQQELNTIEKSFLSQQEENRKIREDDYSNLDKNKSVISSLDETILILENERVDLRNKINIKVGDNQVYRMAQWFWGKESAADIDRKEVVVVASIWFGSLALLIAFTGIMLAAASFVIRDPSIPSKGQKEVGNKHTVSKKLMNSFRRWIYYSKKSARKPVYETTIKEVIKEIPVDKVVFRDKPVEIIKKEIIHVPLYTNDTDLINLSSNGTAGKEKAEKDSL